MRKLSPEQLERTALLRRLNAEAEIVKLRWRNEVIPAYLAEFDKRLASAEPLELQPPSVDELIAEARAHLDRS